MGEGNRRGHKLWGLVAGITEHQSLIASTLLGCALVIRRGLVDALLDIARLLAHSAKHLAGVGVKTTILVGVADVADRLTSKGDEIETGVARNFTGENDEVALGQSLARDTALRILFQTSIEHVIADRIADFIGVTFGNGLGREDMARHDNKRDSLKR